MTAASSRGLTIDCGEGKHDVCCGFGTSSYLIPQTAGERFECACLCHEQPAAQTRITIGPSPFLAWPLTSTGSGQSRTLQWRAA